MAPIQGVVSSFNWFHFTPFSGRKAMSFKRIISRDVEGVKVVKPTDRKILDEGTIRAWGSELMELFQSSAYRVALDFRGVEYFASPGLAQLVTLDRKAHEFEGAFCVFGVRPEILELLNITKMNRRIRILETEEDALFHVTE